MGLYDQVSLQQYQRKKNVSVRRNVFAECKVNITPEVHGDSECHSAACILPWRFISGMGGGVIGSGQVIERSFLMGSASLPLLSFHSH